MMPTETLRLRRSMVLFACALVAIAGCGSGELESPTAKKLKGVCSLYLDYSLNVNQNKGPDNEKDLKRYIQGLPDHVQNSNSVDPKNIDASFMSARDNEPFVIVFGVPVGGLSGKEAPVVAYEKTGRNGRVLVGLLNGKVHLVDQAGLEELKNPKKKD